MSRVSTLMVRYAFAVLFLWFGTEQLLNPDMWVAFLPAWTGYLPVPSLMLIQFNGWFEIVFALLLALGGFTRLVAAALSLHLLGIAVTAGGAIGMRDFALSIMGGALVFSRPDAWTLDALFAKKKTGQTPTSP
ncbi:MAG: DoxX family protein [Candidatus Magasanikbacteria bacterium]|nr:DoxX family protein [Candidatus Magasanikbacteria bacterium]